MTIHPQCIRAMSPVELSAPEMFTTGPAHSVFMFTTEYTPEMVTTGRYASRRGELKLPHHAVRPSPRREDCGSRTDIGTWYVVHPDAPMQRPPQPVKTASKAPPSDASSFKGASSFKDTSFKSASFKSASFKRENSAELDMPPRLTRQRTGETPLLMLATPPPVQRTGLSKDMGTVSVTPSTDTRVFSKLATWAASKLPMAARAAAARAAAGRTAASLEGLGSCARY